MRPDAANQRIRGGTQEGNHKNAAAIRIMKLRTEIRVDKPRLEHAARMTAAAKIHIWRREQIKQKQEQNKKEKTKPTPTKEKARLEKGWARRLQSWKHNMHKSAQIYTAQAEGQTRKVRAFVTHVESQQRRTGIDTYSEISMILDTAVNPAWEVVDTEGIKVKGVGTAKVGKLITVPISFRCGATAKYIDMRVAPKELMPTGIEILIGTKVQHEHNMLIDQGSDRLIIKDQSIVVDTEQVTTIIARQKSKPLDILELAGGMSPAILILSDLGWRIGKWHTSEIDESANRAAEGIARKAGVRITNIGDLKGVSEKHLRTKYDVILASPPCKSFSRAPDDPKGWDSEDGELFKYCCTIIRKQQTKGHKPRVLFENVIIHPRREQDAITQEEHLGIKFKELSATACGGTQERKRRIATNICDIARIKKKERADPNWMLTPTARTEMRTIPCIMASGSRTKAPVKVIDMETGNERYANITELERLQGYPEGITDAWGTGLTNTPKERTVLIGNAWNYHQIAAILRGLKPEEKHWPAIHHMENDGVKISEQEKELHKMSDEQQKAELKKRMEGYTLPKHYFKTKETHNITYQVPIRERARTTPAREPAARAELKLRMQRGHLKLVTYNRKHWISRMFTKGKDRINPETNLEAIRFLTDLRELNSAIDWPGQWNDECPTIEGVASMIPKSAKYFAAEDIKDAYEGVDIDERCRHLLTVAPPFEIWASQYTDDELREFSDEPIAKLRAAEGPLLVQWVGMPQGLASAAPFFNVHLADGLNQLFGEMWREMAAIYVDDLLIHGQTREHCEMRQRLMQNALEALGKALSTKCDRTVKNYGQIVGLKITAEGIEPDDDVIETLNQELLMTPKTEKQARHLIGVIRYSHTAFQWNPDDLLWFSKAMAPMHEAVAQEKFKWNEECSKAIETLKKRVLQMPRAHTDPNTILDKNHCLVIITDACDDGVGAGMWSVNKPNAQEVTMDDLHNTKITKLVAVDAKILDKSQRRWATFEKETYGCYRAMKKWGNLLIQAMSKQGKDKTPKISVRMDNSTATKQWIDMQNPGIIDFAGPKEMRFLGWAEKMSFTRELPMDVSFIPGNMNSFADLVSRIADKLGEAARRKHAASHDTIVAHTEMHTFETAAEE